MEKDYSNNNETQPQKPTISGFDSVAPQTAQNPNPSAAPTQPTAATPTTPPMPTTAATNYSAPPQQNSYIPSGNYGRPVTQATPPAYYTPTPAPKAPKEKKTKRYGIGALISVALIVSILTGSCFYGLYHFFGKDTTIIKKESSSNTPKETTTDKKVVEITGSIEELAGVAAEKASGSVVGVQTTFAVQSFFSGESTATGSGSGVVYKSNGYIITNYHVIADTLEYPDSEITVFLNNNAEEGYPAKVINYNISCDLAVLKIDKDGLQPIEFADSDSLQVGQYVVAIGSPASLAFMGSTTFGIISGLNRQVEESGGGTSLIQTDAAINPGNSGGALVNAKGQLIGINSAKLVDESVEGMGFAIPSNKVKEICDNLIAHEGEEPPYTGISVSPSYTAAVLEYYGYPAGAVVEHVDRGSPAEAAGIKRGDIIRKFGDTEITEYTLYESALSNYYPGDKVEIKFYRSGKTHTVTITISQAN